MQINGSVALVTGAGRGLGRAYAQELISRGAAKVYGAARDPATVTIPGVTPIALDITNPFNASYGASKAAEWSLANSIRTELAPAGTLVVAVHASFIDTGMAAPAVKGTS